jgi:capsular exopolysaccharide synthesis family protein
MEQVEQAFRRAREQRDILDRMRSLNGATQNAATSIAVAPKETKTVALTPSVLEANRLVAAQLHHPLTDVYRSLRAQVLQALEHLNKTTLGITSVNHREGKTLTAVNLAVAIAMDVNQTVLLVDADLRNPGIANCLGLKPSLGLSEYLTGKATIPDCLINPGIERLSILPAWSRIGNSAELLASPKMSELAGELKNRYPDRLIIYDLPPILTVGDTLGFLPSIETTLLVVRDGAVRPRELSRVLDLLNNHNLIGAVLNGVA